MQPGDIPQVLEIERQSFPTMWPQTVYQRELTNSMARYLVACEQEEPAIRDPSGTTGPAGGLEGLLRRLLGAPSGPPAAKDRILGLVGIWFVMGEGHIVTIAVRPEERRRGLGELLLVAALEEAVEAGQEQVTLEYRISNAAARALYEKYGFTQVGVRARYYTDNQEDAVLMTTPLLRSAEYRRLIAERIAAQRARWGDEYPLLDKRLRLINGRGSAYA
jgi:ribosomal-protein-alanine N-acetyltransferase